MANPEMLLRLAALAAVNEPRARVDLNARDEEKNAAQNLKSSHQATQYQYARFLKSKQQGHISVPHSVHQPKAMGRRRG